ncbi:hypothetical protein FOZ62_014389 [Perkinsus olseni]|uniref:EF-hand domain-containing protein n=1 Tax=Perkinsus olseni TaxID=32597 RepID=A0A7J6QET1_PEROL|nr:hypothetical protein FOZ62_014389 [Perkinsus olseni]
MKWCIVVTVGWLTHQVSSRMERAEIREFHRQHYSSMDLNQDGLIDAQELRTTMLGLPVEYHPVAEKSLLDMVHKMDTNQDGIITWEEYVDSSLNDSVTASVIEAAN